MKLILAALLSLVSFNAMAIQRYDTPRMSCERIQAAVDAQGAALLRYPSKRTPGLQLYDRYVSDGSRCDPGQYADRASVPAADTPNCAVMLCKQIESGRDELFPVP